MSIPSDPHNPYASPFGPLAAPPSRRSTTAFPAFAKIVFIIDLVFCILRVPVFVFNLVGIVALQRENNLPLAMDTVEMATGLGIAAFGLAANVGALLRKPWSVWLGWLNVAATLGSVGVGIWQATYALAELVPGTPQAVGTYIGIGFGLVVRLGLLLMYLVALVQFSRWVKRLLHIPSSS